MANLKLGLQLGYWGSGPPANAPELVAEAERLGLRLGLDGGGVRLRRPHAAGVVGVARPTRVRLGTALCQLSARTPTAMAMAAMTLDHLCGGRLVLGLGVSGPQVVEGWYGQPFPKPLARTREYVSIVRQVLAREAPVTNAGPHYPLPYPGGEELGKPLKADRPPAAAATSPSSSGPRGPRTWRWRPRSPTAGSRSSSPPSHMGEFSSALEEGFARPGARRSAEDFEVIAFCPVVVDDDVEKAADLYRPMLALYIGGMGAEEMNFHFDVFVRMGFEAEAQQDPGALPRRPQGRGRRRCADVDGREDRPGRARGRRSATSSPPGRSRSRPPCSWPGAPTSCA